MAYVTQRSSLLIPFVFMLLQIMASIYYEFTGANARIQKKCPKEKDCAI